jgi:hypothetical protein
MIESLKMDTRVTTTGARAGIVQLKMTMAKIHV